MYRVSFIWDLTLWATQEAAHRPPIHAAAIHAATAVHPPTAIHSTAAVHAATVCAHAAVTPYAAVSWPAVHASPVAAADASPVAAPVCRSIAAAVGAVPIQTAAAISRAIRATVSQPPICGSISASTIRACGWLLPGTCPVGNYAVAGCCWPRGDCKRKLLSQHPKQEF